MISYSPLYYSVRNWELHAAGVAINSEETEKSLQLWDFVMRLISDDAPIFKIQNTDFSDYQRERCEELMYLDIWVPYWRIHIASAYGLTSVMIRLINDCERVGSDTDISMFVNLKDVFGKTPLHLASQYGHIAVAQLLVARSDIYVDEKVKGTNNSTPLFLAFKGGHECVV
jgi:hypothetical protein